MPKILKATTSATAITAASILTGERTANTQSATVEMTKLLRDWRVLDRAKSDAQKTAEAAVATSQEGRYQLLIDLSQISVQKNMNEDDVKAALTTAFADKAVYGNAAASQTVFMSECTTVMLPICRNHIPDMAKSVEAAFKIGSGDKASATDKETAAKVRKWQHSKYQALLALCRHKQGGILAKEGRGKAAKLVGNGAARTLKDVLAFADKYPAKARAPQTPQGNAATTATTTPSVNADPVRAVRDMIGALAKLHPTQQAHWLAMLGELKAAVTELAAPKEPENPMDAAMAEFDANMISLAAK